VSTRTSPERFPLVAAIAAASLPCLFACEAPIDTFTTTWTMTLQAPSPDEATQIEWCPQLMFVSGFDPTSGQPTRTANTPAPTNIQATMSVENDDVYSLTPVYNAALYGTEPIRFDIGPIGTFYTKTPTEFAVAFDNQQPPVEPANMKVVRDVVEGTVNSDTDFDLTLDYTMECEGGQLKAGDVTCACEKQRVTWNFKGAGF
jgi:hypothetical protein